MKLPLIFDGSLPPNHWDGDDDDEEEDSHDDEDEGGDDDQEEVPVFPFIAIKTINKTKKLENKKKLVMMTKMKVVTIM